MVLGKKACKEYGVAIVVFLTLTGRIYNAEN
jgi:hypothetical protein